MKFIKMIGGQGRLLRRGPTCFCLAFINAVLVVYITSLYVQAHPYGGHFVFVVGEGDRGKTYSSAQYTIFCVRRYVGTTDIFM